MSTRRGTLPGAQQRSRWSVDVVGGNGDHTTHVASEWFFTEARPTVRASLALRIGPRRPTTVLGLIGYENFPPYGNDMVPLNCISTPDGKGCVRGFGAPSGLALGVGLQQMLGRYGAVRAAVGESGLKWIERPRAGVAKPFIEADAAVNFGSHAAAVVGIRRTVWDENGLHYWFMPITYGLRIF